jgi:uncharacterized membrane protein YhaH (DUF805 family)
MYWYLKGIKQYLDFKSRARRKEYWMFQLFNMFFSAFSMILDNIFGIAIDELGFGPIFGLYALASFTPGLAVTVRRFHDIGKSGWLTLVSLLPLLGPIWLIVLMAKESDLGINEYGDCPKAPFQEEEIVSIEYTRDTIVVWVVVWMFTSRLIWLIMMKFNESHSTEWFISALSLMNLVWAFVPICLALTIKDKSKQNVLFILGSAYLLYGLYDVVIKFIL